MSFIRVEQLVDEVCDRENFLHLSVSLLAIRCLRIVLLTNNIKEELEDLSINSDVRSLESFNELFFWDVTITLSINSSQSLLQSKFFIWEHFWPQVSEDLFGPVESRQIEEVNFFSIVVLK